MAGPKYITRPAGEPIKPVLRHGGRDYVIDHVDGQLRIYRPAEAKR